MGLWGTFKGVPVVSFVPNPLSVLKWTRSMAGKYKSAFFAATNMNVRMFLA